MQPVDGRNDSRRVRLPHLAPSGVDLPAQAESQVAGTARRGAGVQEELEQVELQPAELDGHAVEHQESLRRVEAQAAEHQPVAVEFHQPRRRRLLGWRGRHLGVGAGDGVAMGWSAQAREEPGPQLVRPERLCHVVVGAGGESAEDVVLAGQRTDHDDVRRAELADPSGDLVAVDPGQGHVDGDDRRLVGAHGLDAGGAVGGHHRVEAGVGQHEGEQLGDLGVVLDHDRERARRLIDRAHWSSPPRPRAPCADRSRRGCRLAPPRPRGGRHSPPD